MSDDLLSPEEIEALLNSAGAVPPATPARSSAGASAEQLIEEAEAGLAAAVAPVLGREAGRGSSARSPGHGSPAAFDFPQMAAASGSGDGLILEAIQDVELDLRVELGRAELLIDEVLKLREGSVVALDKLAGDPVDILVNGRLIARGEVLVLNDNFCVRVAEILTPAA